MIDPGKLATRLQLEAPLETPDGQGGVVRGYTTTAVTWAQVTLMAGGDNGEGAAAGADLRVRILTRAPFAVTLRHRLIDGTRSYRITGYRSDGYLVAIDAVLRVE